MISEKHHLYSMRQAQDLEKAFNAAVHEIADDQELHAQIFNRRTFRQHMHEVGMHTHHHYHHGEHNVGEHDHPHHHHHRYRHYFLVAFPDKAWVDVEKHTFQKLFIESTLRKALAESQGVDVSKIGDMQMSVQFGAAKGSVQVSGNGVGYQVAGMSNMMRLGGGLQVGVRVDISAPVGQMA